MSETHQLLEVDPSTLVIGANVRLDPRLDQEFIDSIRRLGVLQPIGVHADEDRLVVDWGQRRTLAAVMVGRPTVPVYLIDAASDVDRVVAQIVENDRRAPLTEIERVQGFTQLAAFGLTAGQIAEAASAPPDQVDAALRVSRSTVASQAAASRPFAPLEHLAVIAEFDDESEIAERLSQLAGRPDFDHAAQRARDRRAERLDKERVAGVLEAEGTKVIAEPDWPRRDEIRLDRLTDADDRTPLTVETHHECPGHAAFVGMDWVDIEPADTDNLPDAEDDGVSDVDRPDEDDLEDEDDQEGDYDEEGQPTRVYRACATFVCIDPAEHGHKPRYRSSFSLAKPRYAELDDAEIEARRAERRDVIESNRAWRSAETVRRRWLKEFLTRKKVPTGTEGFIAAALTHREHQPSQSLSAVCPVTYDLFGIPEDQRPSWSRSEDPLADMADAAGPGRAHMISLGVLLGAYESATSVESWRTVNTGTARYLHFLESAGYDLSTVERRAAGDAFTG